MTETAGRYDNDIWPGDLEGHLAESHGFRMPLGTTFEQMRSHHRESHAFPEYVEVPHSHPSFPSPAVMGEKE